jgi:hypothetical protein
MFSLDVYLRRIRPAIDPIEIIRPKLAKNIRKLPVPDELG